MKYIKDWKRILIDTTVLCSLFRAEKSVEVYSVDLFVKKLITYLSRSKTSAGEDRIFIISAITIAEMITNEEDSEKIKRIMRVLSSNNIEIVEFDLEVAIAFNSQLRKCLNKEHLHARAIEMGFKTGDFAMAREWITKDYMIAMSGLQNNSDVQLTADINTYYPLSKDISNLNCVLTYSELFNQSENFILGYKPEEVEGFIKNHKSEKAIKQETAVPILQMRVAE